MKAARIIAVLIAALWWSAAASAADRPVYIARVEGAVSPGTADFIRRSIEKANDADAGCLIILLDTPGGLVASMRAIVQDIYESRVPVVVFVAPSGARAASAGVMITMAADVAAMAPGTNIGAAHPVGTGGRDIGGTMSEKVTNDMVAYARGIAEKRGRNSAWVEKAVRESVSVTDTEALDRNIIDLVARDVDDLIEKINGRKVGEKATLALDASRRVIIEETLRDKILKTISDPDIAYILMMIGLAGLYFEFSHPGAVFPGVIGGLSLILAFFAFNTLPVNAAGVLLIALALILFIMEMKISSYGLLSVAGVLALLLGSVLLFEKGAGVSLSLQVMVPAVLVVSGFFIVLAGLVFRAHFMRPRTGSEGLVGERGVVRQALAPRGKVLVRGELWRATAGQPLPVGARVRVVGVAGLELTVEPVAEHG